MLLVFVGALVVLCLLVFFCCLYVFLRRETNLVRYESEQSFSDYTEGLRHPFPSLDSDASLQLSVIVPAYNEEERLPPMLNEAIEYLQQRSTDDHSFTWEIIIVDDGSRDSTTEVGGMYTRKYGHDKIRVLTLKHNRGKGGAVRLGCLSARGRNILFADADGATEFHAFGRLERELEKLGPRGIVCGSRAHLEEDSIAQRTIFRTFLMKAFHILVWALCVRSVRDSQCGFKLLGRRASRFLFNNIHVERWAFDVELLYLAESVGLPICEVPVPWQEIDGSKLDPATASVQMALDMIRIRVNYMTNHWKIDKGFLS